jgi:hypothetical protein
MCGLRVLLVRSRAALLLAALQPRAIKTAGNKGLEMSVKELRREVPGGEGER